MDGRGENWVGHNPVYPRKMMPPKMIPKGPPFMMQMMPQKGVYPKSGPASPILMNHGMGQMPPSRISPYAEGVGPMPKMMGIGGPGFIHPKMKMTQRGMMPHMKPSDPMANHSPRMNHASNGVGSPPGMGHQHLPPRHMGPVNNNMVLSSPPMPPSGMGGGMSQGVSPRRMGPNLSPLSMGANRGPSNIMSNNLSPKSLVQRFPPEPVHQHGGMLVTPNRGPVSPHLTSQMMCPPKMSNLGPPIGVKMPPSGMGYGHMGPHMGIQGRLPGVPIPKPKLPLGMHMGPHMKSGPATSGHHMSHHAGSRQHDHVVKPSRPPARRAPEPQLERDPPPSISSPPSESEQGETSAPDDKEVDSELTDNMKKSVISLVREQLVKAEGLYAKKFTLSDESELASTMIDGFLPILNTLWDETKKSHKYSLDEMYLKLSGPDSSVFGDLQVRREMEHLEDYYRSKTDLERLLSLYRSYNKGTMRDAIIGGVPGDSEMSAMMRAQEYAEVGYNQRNLVKKITALDYRNALENELCRSMFPESFRTQQIKMASSLHFDVRTPPQCVSPPAESVDSDSAAAALSKCASTMESSHFSSVASKLMSKSSSTFFDKMGDMPMLPLDMRYTGGPQMMPAPDMLMPMGNGKAGFGGMQMPFPKGVNFPMVQMPKLGAMRPPVSQVPPKGSPKPGSPILHGQRGPVNHAVVSVSSSSPALPVPMKMVNPSHKFEAAGMVPGSRPPLMKKPPPMFNNRFT
ncbi:uncharacterized protein BXIN_1865 [Babesia sp. Xinjiang]|uniref:uncharacterized protein n=1 Tax=Babesia sp. Xinjiang TaxID=462227 RepID=UPI000A23DD56|nr:uncharacterized protein BXIN_1865 [Babesia sp. Xinjiang]ORM40407.1 hypothetical protein BXIN_1865 [Babesia sp. Xinjiang]